MSPKPILKIFLTFTWCCECRRYRMMGNRDNLFNICLSYYFCFVFDLYLFCCIICTNICIYTTTIYIFLFKWIDSKLVAFARTLRLSICLTVCWLLSHNCRGFLLSRHLMLPTHNIILRNWKVINIYKQTTKYKTEIN